MKIAVLIARIAIGLAFFTAGISGFLIRTPPAMPDLAGAFQDVYFKSHYVFFVAAVQAIVGVLFLVDRFIGLALVISAALIFNILVFHITMFPLGIFPGLVLLALWLLVAFHVRPHLEPLLAAKTTTRR